MNRCSFDAANASKFGLDGFVLHSMGFQLRIHYWFSMFSGTMKYIILLSLFWIAGTIVSFKLTQDQMIRSDDRVNLQTARAFAQHIVITREWNSKHGGVYLVVNDATRPNPYIKAPHRDILSDQGTMLTLVNPAYMTKMISQIAEKYGKFRFHITSLNPLNPANEPADWELEPLSSFENQQRNEYATYSEKDGQIIYRYIVPLIAKQSCLKCHTNQGYRPGKVGGAISVSLPIEKNKHHWLWISYLMGGSLGLAIIMGFGRQIFRLNVRLQRQALIDGLTQISNRRFFDDYLHSEWLRSRRNEKEFALILCDVDYFKQYNDQYGHQEGDICLQRIARTLQESLQRGGDLVARYGGEEFVVVLPETSGIGAMAVAEHLRAMIENLKLPHALSEVNDYVTISLGVAVAVGGELSEKEMLELADQALYQSKMSGRNTVRQSAADRMPQPGEAILPMPFINPG